MGILSVSHIEAHQLKGTSFYKALFIYICVSLFLFFEMAVQVSPSVMAQDLMRDLKMSALSLGVMSSVYFYTYTFMQIPSGLLFDRYNPGKIIFLAVLVCSIGAFAFGYAANFYLACADRLLMGLGSAINMAINLLDIFIVKNQQMIIVFITEISKF